jgi:hypothetical protein
VAGKVADFPLPIMAEEVDSNSTVSPPSAATPASQMEADISIALPPPAAAPGSQMEIEPTPDGPLPPSSHGLNVHRGGPPSGPYRGHMGSRLGSRPSTSAAAYSTVAASKRNYLIHVYKSRDDLEPFLDVDEFYTLRDQIKTSIWSFFVDNTADRDLSVKDWAFQREKSIGLIFCNPVTPRVMEVMDLTVDYAERPPVVNDVQVCATALDSESKEICCLPQSGT